MVYGVLYLRLYVENGFALLGALTIKGDVKLACVKSKTVSNDHVKLAAKDVKATQFFNFRKRGLLHLAWYCILTNDPYN